MTRQPLPEQSTSAPAGRQIGSLVAALLILASTVIGVFAYWQFTVSGRHLARTLEQVRALGPGLTTEQCVDTVVEAAAHCEAMKSLCDASAAGWMKACLEGRDRSAHCASLGGTIHTTGFGYSACKARKVDVRTKKTCASAYRAVAEHCTSLGGKKETWLSSGSPSRP